MFSIFKALFLEVLLQIASFALQEMVHTGEHN